VFALSGKGAPVRLTLGRPSALRDLVGRRSSVERVLLIVGCLALLAIWLVLVQDPPRVDVTVANPSTCAVWVEVGQPGGTGIVSLGSMPAGRDTAALGVLDRGAIWRMAFFRDGIELGSDTVTRQDLADAGWRYVIPNRPEFVASPCPADSPA